MGWLGFEEGGNGRDAVWEIRVLSVLHNADTDTAGGAGGGAGADSAGAAAAAAAAGAQVVTLTSGGASLVAAAASALSGCAGAAASYTTVQYQPGGKGGTSTAGVDTSAAANQMCPLAVKVIALAEGTMPPPEALWRVQLLPSAAAAALTPTPAAQAAMQTFMPSPRFYYAQPPELPTAAAVPAAPALVATSTSTAAAAATHHHCVLASASSTLPPSTLPKASTASIASTGGTAAAAAHTQPLGQQPRQPRQPRQPPRCLSGAELRSFVRDGIVVVEQAASTASCAAAKAYINVRLGTPATALAKEGNIGELDGGICNARPLLNLPKSPEVARLIEQLMGPGCVAWPEGAQVALRFPRCSDDLVEGGAAVHGPVITGKDWHTDGLRQGRKHSFSLLVGVALSDMVQVDMGNLAVWRGRHLQAHRLMRWPDGSVDTTARAGAAASAAAGASAGAADTATSGAKANTADGQRDAAGAAALQQQQQQQHEMQQQLKAKEPKQHRLPDFGPCEQVKLRAGDVVFAHSTLPHCGAPHSGADIRYVVMHLPSLIPFIFVCVNPNSKALILSNLC